MPEPPPQRHHTINTHAYKNTYEQTHISTQAKEELSCPEKDLWIRTAEPLGGLAEAQLSSTEIRFGWIGISAGMWPKKATQAEKKKGTRSCSASQPELESTPYRCSCREQH